MKIMTAEEIKELLKIQGYTDENFKKIYVSEIFNNFIAGYINNNPSNSHFIKKQISQLNSVALFSEAFSEMENPIEWYSDDFWMLFSFREMENAKYDWKNSAIRGNVIYKVNDKEHVKFLKKYYSKNQAEKLTKYLTLNTKASLELTIYWLEIIKKLDNKNLIKNKQLPPFIARQEDRLLKEAYYFFAPKGKKNKNIISYLNVLAICNTDESFEKIKEIHQLESNNAEILKEIEKITEKLGKSLEKININFDDQELEETFFVYKKHINPQALIKKNILSTKEVAIFLELISYFMKTELERKSIKLECEWFKKHDSLTRVERNLYEIKATMDYEFQKKETTDWINEVLNVSIKSFLIDNRSQLKNYNVKNYDSKEKFCNDFNEYLKLAPLKITLEEELNSELKESPKIKKAKI